MSYDDDLYDMRIMHENLYTLDTTKEQLEKWEKIKSETFEEEGAYSCACCQSPDFEHNLYLAIRKDIKVAPICSENTGKDH